MEQCRKTPLFERHQQLGGRMVDFSGWCLPVQYAGILEEHKAVREKAGLFDVSHMGEIRITGKHSTEFLQYVMTNEFATLKPGWVRYSPMCYPTGGTVDDVLVYCFSPTEYLLVVNAGNIEKDYCWLTENAAAFDVAIENESADFGEVALQGPCSRQILQRLTGEAEKALAYYEFSSRIPLCGVEAMISRTGYTGEDGYEIYCRGTEVVKIWDALLEAGHDLGLQPAGLGCRDTLRFEAAMPLYGHELSADISPLEAGLAKFISFDKTDFLGRESLLRQKQEGVPRKLLGFEMIGRGIARAGYPVYHDGAEVGVVTSGSFAPALAKNLGLALVKPFASSPGTKIEIEIREKKVEASVIEKPFYRRK